MTQPKQRLASLDILRGFDLFLLVGLHPILLEMGKLSDNTMLHAVLYQFDHEVWEGFRVWDLIMPLFLFMTGITIPFSLDSKKDQPKLPIYQHILRRFVILWILGMVVQGNLLRLDWQQIKFYSNTLQAIATGYAVTSILYLNLNIRKIVLLGILLLVVYSVPFLMHADYSRMGNFAIELDKMVLGRFMDAAYQDNGVVVFSEYYDYSWLWSSLTFSVTVMMGCLAGSLLKNGFKTNPKRTFYQLVILGFVCIALGLLWSFQMPIIKRIWTSSMTLFSGGICFLLMALFYYIIDLKQIVKPFEWLKIYGMNSIVAYVMGEIISFRSVVHSVTYGLEDMFPTYQSFILTAGNYTIVFLLLFTLYKYRIFVKI